MLLTIDQDSNYLIQSPALAQAVSQLSFKRGVTTSIVVQFARDGLVTQLSDGATGKFMLKEQKKYDGPAVIQALSWTKQDSAYIFQPNFDTQAIRDLLGIDPPDTTDDKDSVTLMGEIEWITTAGKFKTQPWKAVVYNCVISSDDSPPVEFASSASARVAIPSGAESVAVVFPTALDHVPTVITPAIYAPSGVPGFAAWVDVTTITATGFTAILGGIPAVTGYELGYTAI